VIKEVTTDNMNVNHAIQNVENVTEIQIINVQNAMDKKDYMKVNVKINALQEHL